MGMLEHGLIGAHLLRRWAKVDRRSFLTPDNDTVVHRHHIFLAALAPVSEQ